MHEVYSTYDWYKNKHSYFYSYRKLSYAIVLSIKNTFTLSIRVLFQSRFLYSSSSALQFSFHVIIRSLLIRSVSLSFSSSRFSTSIIRSLSFIILFFSRHFHLIPHRFSFSSHIFSSITKFCSSLSSSILSPLSPPLFLSSSLLIIFSIFYSSFPIHLLPSVLLLPRFSPLPLFSPFSSYSLTN